MKKTEIINFWITSANKDLRAMGNMFKHGHFVWALFLGHLILEKLLKAVYVQNVGESVPFIHDLTKIAEKAGLTLTDIQKDFLDTVSTFNIRARYPDYKGKFYKRANKKFTEKNIKDIKDFRQWLLKKIKQ